ncbi:MAG: sigma-54 dependent transcriptional regulator [Acidobacteriota bacterium]|jgi:DNA-binding NtrC family response regulator|nr:sigma-54 dependent transcriptional regulator [Acidobacteriota bacterium]NLT33794.1 sigma-54-dependent Fis family transcriptional regulator [Acidobacteriota bacterium]
MRPKASILIAEDEAQAREALRALLEDEGYRVLCASDGAEASHHLAHSPVEAALLDIRMPSKDGLALLRELKDHPSPPAVLIMTAYGTSAAAIEAMALGAFDYLTKPLNFDELLIQLERAIDNRRKTSELEAYRSEEDAAQGLEIVGRSPAMQKLYKLIGQVSTTDSTVLIRGESGTGKEVVARAIHRHSLRGSRRLVKVNCASIPETLLEAEMFGHERGAFTGAAQRRIGKFQYAAGGTLFLDEIGELSPSTQAKLLRVLQEFTIERLGSNVTIPLDVRLLAATNCDLELAVREGRFREDLYYRLNVVTLTVPPLRERRKDIPELAAFLIRRAAARLKMQTPTLSEDAVELLAARDWPGNVRELEHCLERTLILGRSGVIRPEDVALDAGPPAADPVGGFPLDEGLHAAVARLERGMIERALAASGGNRTRAAGILKINRRLLYDKLREYGLD